MQLVLLILAIIFLILAGLNIRSERFAPEWLGLACLAAAWGWPLITA